MKSFVINNCLSIVFLLLFLGAITGQFIFGLQEYNKELNQEGGSAVSAALYISSGHFLQATFENWESEFLQLALFVTLTIFLMQKGSSESKDFSKEEPVDREPSARRKNVPWPVKAGGWILALYKHSLTIALLVLFLISFGAHFYGSLKDENTLRSIKGLSAETAGNYISDSRFWFESFQNWQSEFFSIFTIVILTIFLRQKGSPQSKPVDAPYEETGS